jgi:hypothetical protein
VTQLKELLPDPLRRIELIDFIESLTNDAIGELISDVLPMSEQPSAENIRQRVDRLNGIVAPIGRALVVGGYYGDLPYHFRIWRDVVERLAAIARRDVPGQSYEIWRVLRQYPALIGLYAFGVASLAAHRPETVAPCLAALGPGETAMLDSSVGRAQIHAATESVVAQESRPVAVSSLLEGQVFSLGEGVIRLEQLEVSFDQLEYLLGLIEAHYSLGTELKGDVYARPVRFWFRQSPLAPVWRPDTWAVGAKATAWLDVGLFDGSADRLDAVKAKYDEAIAHQRMMAGLGF